MPASPNQMSAPRPARRQERRDPKNAPRASRLRAGLTPGQQSALDTLEQFRWTLKFVRMPLFGDPVPVLAHPDGRLVVLAPDGSLDAAAGIRLRD